MQIDWLTVIAQAVNFLILVYLLRRFLYQPVMRAMAQREARIAEQLSQAQSREQEAAREAEHHRERSEAFEREREARLRTVAQEAEALRATLLDEARRDVERKREDWQRELAREQRQWQEMFRPRAAAALTHAARRMLADMADVELEQQLIRSFMRQLENLDHAELANVRRSAHKAGRIRVSTSFEADADTRARIRRALQHHLLEEREVDIDFHRSDSLVCGIEVNTDGRKIGWTLDNYLDTLGEELARGAPSPAEPGRD